jgi:hypothetical protein
LTTNLEVANLRRGINTQRRKLNGANILEIRIHDRYWLMVEDWFIGLLVSSSMSMLVSQIQQILSVVDNLMVEQLALKCLSHLTLAKVQLSINMESTTRLPAKFIRCIIGCLRKSNLYVQTVHARPRFEFSHIFMTYLLRFFFQLEAYLILSVEVPKRFYHSSCRNPQ